MLILLLIALFLLVALALFAVGAAWLAPASRAGARLRLLLGAAEAKPKPTLAEKIQTAIEPAAKLLPTSASEASRTRLWLMQAGYRDPRHARLYFGLRALAVIAPLLAVLGSGLEHTAPVLLLLAPGAGLVLPRFVLKKRVAARSARIRLSLPDALDLMVICVEAGLGLDQALQRVALELKPVHPDLCGEFELLVLEMRAGVPRSEALRNLSERCDVDDLRALAAVLIQTDRFGTSVAQALRVHSEALRSERRQRAEEAAAKLSIKMLPVLALFVFPAVMIVVLGPAAISLVRHLGPVLAQ